MKWFLIAAMTYQGQLMEITDRHQSWDTRAQCEQYLLNHSGARDAAEAFDQSPYKNIRVYCGQMGTQ